MDANAAARKRTSGSLALKIEGLDCQNEVRALRAAVGPVAGGDDKLSFDTKAGVMTITPGNASMLEAVQRAVSTTGMRAHALPQQGLSPLLFRVAGLDCKNEVASLKREVGPMVGSDAWLSFDVGKGLMTVAPHERANAEAVVEKVRRTGMTASLVSSGASSPILLRVDGLDCKNEVAALTRALGPLVDEENLAFDTEQGTMTLFPAHGASLAAIQEAVAETGMRAESWLPPDAKAEAPTDVQSDVACGCASDVPKALGRSLPTVMPGGVVFRIHGMDCADEIAALKREVGPLIGEDRLAFDLLNGRMSVDMAPDSEIEARIEKAVAARAFGRSPGQKVRRPRLHRRKNVVDGYSRG